jgi:hypothetical protein
MATVPGVYQIGIDREIDDQNQPNDRFGTDAAGHLLVSGGHLTKTDAANAERSAAHRQRAQELHIELRA